MATPKTTSTTTIVRKGKGRGKGTSTVDVLDTTPEVGEYLREMEEDDLENSDSDATELYEILANMTGPEEEIKMNLEPEIEPQSDSIKGMTLGLTYKNQGTGGKISL